MTQSEYNNIISFLNDIKKNPNTIRIGEESIQNMIDSLVTYTEGTCNFLEVNPTDSTYKDNLSEYGVVLSALQNPYINEPTSVRKVGKEIWISNYLSEIVKFDLNFSYLGALRGLSFGNPASANAFMHCVDFSTNYDPISDTVTRVLLISDDHIAKVYEKDANEMYQLLFTIGTDTIPGNAPELNTPTGCEFLPNGDFVIVNNKGGTNNSGTVLQYDGATGALVKTQLEDSGTNLGSVWDSECTNPTSVKVHDNMIYISTERDEIGAFDITDPINWLYKTVYTKPKGYNYNILNPKGISIGSTDILIGTASSELLQINIDSHDLVSSIGTMKYDNTNTPYLNINEFGSIDAVQYMYDELDNIIGAVVIDRLNNRVQLATLEEEVKIPFTVNIPANKRIIKCLNTVGTFNEVTNELSVPVQDLDKVQSFYIVLDEIRDCPL